jgi:hypothetical protein
VSNSGDAGLDPAASGGAAPTAPSSVLLRRGKWLAIIGAALYLLLILIPFKLLLDQQALHRAALEYVTSDDRWILYRTHIEYANLMSTLFRANAGDASEDLNAIRTAVDVLASRADTARFKGC